jgi:iron complex transport system substrate-binding protein
VPDLHRLPAHANWLWCSVGSVLILVAAGRGVLAHPAYRWAVILRALALVALIGLASCSPRYQTEIKLVPAPTPQRIVSLVPSMTEDLFAVGAGDKVVGVSTFTDYPPQAKRLPVVASFASIATERVIELHADLALGITAQDRLAGDLRRAGIPVVLMRDDSYGDIFRNLTAIGAITGRQAEAAALVERLRARTAALLRTVQHRARKPSVFVVLGTSPVYTVGKGSYIVTLIEMAGGRNAAADIDEPYARYSAEALVARQPDLLIVEPEVRLNDVLRQPPWNALRAVKQHRVYTLPDAAILERPGPRYNDGLAWLIATLHHATR